MAYSLSSALGGLEKGAKTGKPFSLFHNGKTAKSELVIGTAGTSDLALIKKTTGALLPGARGKCRRLEDNSVVFRITEKKEGAANAVITRLCKAKGVAVVSFKEGPVLPEEQGELSEGNDDIDNGPLPQTPTNQNPLTQPGNGPLPQTPTNQTPLTPNRPTQPAPQQPPQQQFQRVAPRRRGAITMTPRSATATFSPSTMESVKKATDRGLLKGQGDFGKVFKGVESLQKIEDKLKGPNNQLDQQGKAKMIQAYDLMLNNVSGYMQGREGEPKDGVVKLKQEFCRKTEASLRLARAQLKYGDKYDRLSQLNQKANMTEDEETEAEQTRAELLIRANEDKQDQKPVTGSSDVRFIRDDNGKVAYVFKSLAGESTQMEELVKGEGTAHEVLNSKLSDVFAGFGFNTGFPKTNMATLPLSNKDGSRSNEIGALVEGLPGRAPTERREARGEEQILKMVGIDFNEVEVKNTYMQQGMRGPEAENEAYKDKMKALGGLTPEQKKQVAASMNGRLSKIGVTWSENTPPNDMATDFESLASRESDDLVAAVAPKQMQQVLLTGLLSSSADVKWSNVMIDGENARPFDGGGSMLTAEQLKKRSTAFGGKIDPLHGSLLLMLPSGNPHPAANSPVDPELRAQVLNIDPDVVQAEMRIAVQKMQGVNDDLQNALGESNVQASVGSLICTQNALKANPNATTAEFLAAVQLNMKNWMESDTYPAAPQRL